MTIPKFCSLSVSAQHVAGLDYADAERDVLHSSDVTEAEADHTSECCQGYQEGGTSAGTKCAMERDGGWQERDEGGELYVDRRTG